MSILTFIIMVPVLGALLVALAGRVSTVHARTAALAATLIDLVAAFVALLSSRSAPLVVDQSWIGSFGVSFSLQLDGVSAVLVLLTALLGSIAILISWREITEKIAAFHVWLLLLQTGILIVFMARDLMLFYFGWELMLIPMFFLIGVWGHEEKLASALKFFLFTFTGSVFLLAALLYVYFQHAAQTGQQTFSLTALMETQLTWEEQWWVFLGLFLGFAVKVPLFPLHTWLPAAHTQAPTAGSLILAGLLLKTGVYGFMRIAIPLVPDGALAFTPMVIFLSVFGIFYGAIAAFTQRDFKRLVAYSSISHLGFVVLGLFSGNLMGFQGAVLQMVNHGLATGALFVIAGLLQERTHTRNFELFGGMWRQMPTLGAFLLFFAFASLGIPGTGNFVGELYVVAGAFARNPWLGGLACFGILFAAVYSLRAFVAVMHGPETRAFKHLTDSHPRENLALGILAAALILIGFYPAAVTAPVFYPHDDALPQSVLLSATSERHPTTEVQE